MYLEHLSPLNEARAMHEFGKNKGRNYQQNGRAAVPRGAGGEALRRALRQHRPTGPLLLRVRHLTAVAVDLDQRERLVMLEGCRSPGAANAATGDFFAVGEGSHKVSLDGDFSIQVSPGHLGPGFMEIIHLGF